MFELPLKYNFPKTAKQLNSLGFMWHVPILLLSINNLEIIMQLLTALFLEKSIIVVSDDKTKLSGVILGLIEMLKPF